MGLMVGYNWAAIVKINVPTPVGRPKTFSIATYVALKGVPSPPRFQKPRGLKRLLPIFLMRTAFIVLRTPYNCAQIVSTLVLWLC